MYEVLSANQPVVRHLKHVRSHSLKPPSSKPLVKHRSKRTLSLPARSKPLVIPPLITVNTSRELCSEWSEEEDIEIEKYEICKLVFTSTSTSTSNGRAWLAQLIRSLPSNQKVPGSILALPRFEYLCNFLSCLS